MPNARLMIGLLAMIVVTFSTTLFADTQVPQDRAKLIDELLTGAKLKDQLLRVQQKYPQSEFYKDIVAQFNEDFDSDKLKKVLEWQRSSLGQKYSALNVLDEGIPNPLDMDALSLLVGPRLKLFEQIRELQGNLALVAMKVVFKESIDALNGLLPTDEQMNYQLREKAYEARVKTWEDSNSAIELNSMASLYKSFSDDELSQLIDYLRSDQFQWFNNCLLKGYLRTLIPAVKDWVNHHGLETEVGHQLKEEFELPDSQAWYVTYFYRAKENDRVIPILKDVLASPELLASPSRNAQLVHFFATVIKGQAALKAQVEQLKGAYGGGQQDFIQAVIQEAAEYKPAGLDTLEGIDRAWAEFFATGDKNIIKNIISLLGVHENGSNQEFLRKVQVSILKNAAKDVNIKRMIVSSADHADRISKEKIDRIISIEDTLGDFAYDLNFRGVNYENNHQYDEAIRAFKLALTYEPDDDLALVNLSQTLYDNKDPEKMLLYVPAAIYLYPKSEGVNQLGVYYYNKHFYVKAIKYFTAALALEPTWPPYIHNLALTYFRAGSKVNAIKYYTQYLVSAPDGQFADEAFHYLASVGAPFKENGSDPFVMLKNKDYDKLEEYFSSLLKAKQKDKYGRSNFYNIFQRFVWPSEEYAYIDQVLDLFDHWISQRPASHFANSAIGCFYIKYAWHARGSGIEKTVTKQGWDLFKKRLLKAQEYLEKAYDKDPSDVIAPIELIVVARGLGLDKDYAQMQFQKAVKIDPSSFEAYTAELEYLKPKWMGTQEEMLDFARKSADNAPPHTLIPSVLILAHWEIYLAYQQNKDITYFKKPGVWQEVKKTYERLLNDFPDLMPKHNWYARMAYLAGDFDTARQQFAIIQDKWDEACWQDKEYFEQVKKEVLSGQ